MNSGGGGYSRKVGGMSRLAGAPVVKWLLVSNIVIFIIEMLLNQSPVLPAGYRRGHDSWLWDSWFFSVEAGIYGGEFWRFLTFQFLHGDGWHLFGNMLGLFFFGTIAERWWGSRRFAFFYLSCGVAGALFYTLLLWLPGLLPLDMAGTRMIGASAGVYGILIAVAVIAPNLKVLLYFVLPVSMRFLAIGVLCYGMYTAFTNGENAGGEAAHIGGALLGFIFMRRPRLLSFIPNGMPRGSGGGLQGSSTQQVSAAGVVSSARVDEILDKVNEQGVHSLTDEEKEVLIRSAKQ